jgi:hypothetical protein
MSLPVHRLRHTFLSALPTATHNASYECTAKCSAILPTLVGHALQDKSVLELAHELARLQGAAAANQLSMQDVSGGTFSLSNIGTIGGTYATPLVNSPEVRRSEALFYEGGTASLWTERPAGASVVDMLLDSRLAAWRARVVVPLDRISAAPAPLCPAQHCPAVACFHAAPRRSPSWRSGRSDDSRGLLPTAQPS